MTYFLKKTRKGLNLRAVGESPATADAAGINVSKYKYAATVTGAAIAGLGGLYFVMEYLGGTWSNNGFGDRGWNLGIFCVWWIIYFIYLSSGIEQGNAGACKNASVCCDDYRPDHHK